MLQQIISHTPLYVWALLAFLISRGTAALRQHERSLRGLAIIPIVMTGLSLQGIANSFGETGLAYPVWFASAGVSALACWVLYDTSSIVADPARGVVIVRGSWLPLALMLAIFCTKYAVGVTLAMQPALRANLGFVAGICAVYGIFSGMFIGRLARSLHAYFRAAPATMRAA